MSESLHKIIPSEEAMLEFAGTFAKQCNSPLLIFLQGNLGAGKTTFVRGFLRGMGYKNKVKSPTYTLVEPYQFANCMVYHFDFYRVHQVKELEYIGIQDYFAENAICLIEWPENVDESLPPADLSCYIESYDSGRKIKIESNTDKGKAILKAISK